MVKINDIKDDSSIWKKGRKNPEIDELIKVMRTWPLGKTKEVMLEKAVKSLGTSLRKAFNGSKTISAKPKDKNFSTWYIKVDKKNGKKKVKTSA